MTMRDNKPKVVCFSCKFGWGYLESEEHLASELSHWVPIICTGKIDSTHILKAFKQGADGVLILGCPAGDCHYQDGNLEARKRVYLLQELLEAHGIERERLRIHLSSDPDGRSIPQLVREMMDTIGELGPLRTPVIRQDTAPATSSVTKRQASRR